MILASKYFPTSAALVRVPILFITVFNSDLAPLIVIVSSEVCRCVGRSTVAVEPLQQTGNPFFLRPAPKAAPQMIKVSLTFFLPKTPGASGVPTESQG